MARRRRTPSMPDAAQLRETVDARNGLATDRRNTRRRERWREREANRRWCECGRELTGTKRQRCTPCVWQSIGRTCRGWGESNPCDIVMETSKLRCPACRILHGDWLRDRRNARRREAYANQR